MPFSLDPDAPATALAAGEKQKLEILKQLYLGVRVLILDEPTSVLTPQESDEVLSHARKLADAGLLTVVLITHKFREVRAHAGEVTVLRGGRNAGGGKVAALDTDALIEMTFGARPAPVSAARAERAGRRKLFRAARHFGAERPRLARGARPVAAGGFRRNRWRGRRVGQRPEGTRRSACRPA